MTPEKCLSTIGMRQRELRRAVHNRLDEDSDTHAWQDADWE